MEYKSYNKMSNNILSILLSEKNFDNKMVVSTGSYILSELPCIVAYKNNDIVGLLTYKVYDEYIEIISLDSFVENKGIGSHLLNYAEIIASDMSKEVSVLLLQMKILRHSISIKKINIESQTLFLML